MKVDAHCRAAGLFALAFALWPLAQLPPVDFDRAAPLLLVPGIWLALRAPALRPAPAARASGLLLTVWFCWALIGVFGALNPATSLVGFSSVSLAVLGGIAASRAASNDPAIICRLLGGITTGAALGLILVFVYRDAAGGGPAWVYGHLRLFGLHQMVGALSGAIWFFLAGTHRERRLALFMAAVAWIGVFWSGSRAPLPALAATAGLWIVFGGGEKRLRTAAIWLGLVAAGLSGSLLLSPANSAMGVKSLVARTVESTSISELSSTRSEFWLVSLSHAFEKPLIGHGPESYRFIRPKQVGEQPHNFVIQFVSDYGLPGAAVLLGVIGTAVVAGLRSSSLQARGAACVGAGLCVAALLDGVAYHAVTLPAFACVLGVALGSRKTADAEQPDGAPGPWLRLALSAAAALLVLHGWLFHQIRFARPPAPDDGIVLLTRAFPSTTFGLWRWFESWEKQNDAGLALAWSQWAAERSDVPALFHVYSARIYVAADNLPAAEAEYRAAIAKSFDGDRPALERLLRLTLAAQNKPVPDSPESPSHP